MRATKMEKILPDGITQVRSPSGGSTNAVWRKPSTRRREAIACRAFRSEKCQLGSIRADV